MRSLVFVSLFVLSLAGAAYAQGSGAVPERVVKGTMPPAEMDRLIKKVTANEAAFREAFTNYVFTRDAVITTIGLGGNITGAYHRTSSMTFTGDGQRFEKILFFPIPTLSEIQMTPEDLEDLGGVNPFALEPSVISQYNFTYVGTEKIDELDLYVFDVAPKIIPDPKKSKVRMFTGRIWVDKDELMIVKSKGKAVPETKQNKFPIVETWRENIDGKYWFPTYVYSDDHLVFDSGQVVHTKMKVTYKDYKLGRGEIKLLDEDAKPEPSPTPKKP